MAQYTTKDRMKLGKNIIDSGGVIFCKDIIHPLMLVLSRSKIKYDIFPINELKVLPDRPVIFTVNHYSSQDTPIACHSIDRRAYILAGKQKLYDVDETFFNMNGALFVDRKDNEDMALSKDAMCAYLRKGQALIYFPEATWNLDDARLMLPMKWGIIDVARETDAQIVPIVLHYDDFRKKCYVRYEEPMVCSYDNKKIDEINKLRDTMATAKWKFIEAMEYLDYYEPSDEEIISQMNYIFGDDVDLESLYSYFVPYTREWTDIEELRNRFKRVISEYPPLDAEYEASCIYLPYDSKEKVFEPVNKLTLSKNNAFLLRGNRVV